MTLPEGGRLPQSAASGRVKRPHMGIYLLKWKHDQHGELNYGEYAGFVVIASDTDSAREEASRRAGTEGRQLWLNEQLTVCARIGTADQKQPWKPHVILRAKT